MHDIRDELQTWIETEDAEIVVAVVTELQGSGLRKPGACIAVSSKGRIAGSISGGCVEPQILETAERMLAGDAGILPCIRLSADTDPVHNPLAPCSIALEITLSRLDREVFKAVSAFSRRRRTPQQGTPVWGIHHDLEHDTTQCFAYDPEFDSLTSGLDSQPLQRRRELLQSELIGSEASQARWIHGQRDRLFVVPVERRPVLCIVGASHIAQHLSAAALQLDYEVHVCDPRSRFVQDTRFHEGVELHTKRVDRIVKELVVDESCAVAVLSHDDKIDDAALAAALSGPAFYIGALGSRKTHAARVERLTESGFSSDELARVHAPIGLGIHAVSPAEIAISVLAEIVSRHRAPGYRP